MTPHLHNYRVWIVLSGLALGALGRWERFIDDLESRVPGLGPVLSWNKTARAALVVLSTDDANAAAAVRVAVVSITESLERTATADVHPARIDIDALGHE